MATEVCRNFLHSTRRFARVINLCSTERDLSSYLSKDIIDKTKYLLGVIIFILLITSIHTHIDIAFQFIRDTQVSNNDAARIYICSIISLPLPYRVPNSVFIR